MRPAGGVFEEEDPERRASMDGIKGALALIAGVAVGAVVVLLLLAAPGFLSDRDSTVPVVPATQEAGR